MRAIAGDGTIQMEPDYPGPNGLMRLFDAGIKGQADIDVAEVVMSMMEDVRDSAQLAAFHEFRALGLSSGESAARAEHIALTVDDFLGNAYGDL